MTNFLDLVAEDLVARFGKNLSELTIVFPGRRAARFMNASLARSARGALWAPRYKTIDEIFQGLSPYTPSDNVRNVCELYGVYRRLAPKPRTLDEFFSWGEVLMNDFEDIDKHLADANLLFKNIDALAEMDDDSYVGDARLEALRAFFSDLKAGNDEGIRHRFREMWDIMPGMYHGLKESLRAQGMMFRGALYREVAEDLARGENPFTGKKYAVVGFNVLDEVEKALFRAMKEGGATIFYWDYDEHYIRGDNEAGAFVRENLRDFPNALQGDFFDNLNAGGKKIRLVATDTDNAQVRYLPTWVRDKLTVPENQSLVVLCDEALVQATLHSIPTEKDANAGGKLTLNVTMGFPVTGTPVHSYYMSLLELQAFGYNSKEGKFRLPQLSRLMGCPFHDGTTPEHKPDTGGILLWLRGKMEALGKELAKGNGGNGFADLYSETVFRLFQLTNQLLLLHDEGKFRVGPKTLCRVVRQATRSVSVPFHGDSTEGLQVMGLLETRCLDFRHIIMLSVEEGFMPKDDSDVSMIPYCLRENFRLDTIERKTAVYAYYFYRLIQRAEDVTFMYNESSAGVTRHEQSRFLRQLRAETTLDIECLSLGNKLSVSQGQCLQVTKTEEVTRRLRGRFDVSKGAIHSLSPSALGTYLTCHLKFYYQNVVAIPEPVQETEGIDNALFGTLFHDSAQLFYQHLCRMLQGNDVERVELEAALRGPKECLYCYINLVFWLDHFHAKEYDANSRRVERATFLETFLSSPTREALASKVDELYSRETGCGPQDFTGMNMIVRDVVLQYLMQLLRHDAENAPFRIHGLEEPVSETMDITDPKTGETTRISLGGRIDRMDIVSDNAGNKTLRVIDYKTGTPDKNALSMEEIFEYGSTPRARYYLQTLLYSVIMRRNLGLPVSPCLFYVTKATDPKAYDPVLNVDNKRLDIITDDMEKDFRQRLSALVAEIFDPDVPFAPAENKRDSCKYCQYKRLCGVIKTETDY